MQARNHNFLNTKGAPNPPLNGFRVKAVKRSTTLSTKATTWTLMVINEQIPVNTPSLLVSLHHQWQIHCTDMQWMPPVAEENLCSWNRGKIYWLSQGKKLAVTTIRHSSLDLDVRTGGLFIGSDGTRRTSTSQHISHFLPFIQEPCGERMLLASHLESQWVNEKHALPLR